MNRFGTALIPPLAVGALLAACSSPAAQPAPAPSGIIASIFDSDPALSLAGRAYGSTDAAGSGQYQVALEALAKDPDFLALAKELGVSVVFTPGTEATLVITADDGSNACTVLATVDATALTCNPPGLQ